MGPSPTEGQSSSSKRITDLGTRMDEASQPLPDQHDVSSSSTSPSPQPARLRKTYSDRTPPGAKDGPADARVQGASPELAKRLSVQHDQFLSGSAILRETE